MADDPYIYIYMSAAGPTLWVKRYVWHLWKDATPEPYAEAMRKLTGKKSDGPCWWGMHEEAPDEKGYRFIGKFVPGK